MEIKLKEIVNANDTLTKLANATGLSSVVAYRIMKNIKLLSEELELFEKNRMNIIKKYCAKDDGGKPLLKENNYTIPNESLQEFNEQINELLEETATIDFKTLNIEKLDSLGLTPLELGTIEFLIEE